MTVIASMVVLAIILWVAPLLELLPRVNIFFIFDPAFQFEYKKIIKNKRPQQGPL